MAKSFAQLAVLLAMLGLAITIPILQTTETMLGVFMFIIPAIGLLIFYLAWKSGNLWQNAEIIAIGIAFFILGITFWMGNMLIGGFPLKSIGLVVAIGIGIFLLMIIIRDWKWK